MFKTNANLLRACLLDKDTFTFAVLHNCVSLYNKNNINEVHQNVLGGDPYAIELMKRVEKFNDARAAICDAFLSLNKNECLETLQASEMIEEHDMKSKTLLVCSKRRSTSKTFIIDRRKLDPYKAFFYVFHFDKIIKEKFLGQLKKQKEKLAILSSMTFNMWLLFTKYVVLLLDHVQ